MYIFNPHLFLFYVKVYRKKRFSKLIDHIFLNLPHMKLYGLISYFRFEFFSLNNADAIGEGLGFLAYDIAILNAHSSNVAMG